MCAQCCGCAVFGQSVKAWRSRRSRVPPHRWFSMRRLCVRTGTHVRACVRVYKVGRTVCSGFGDGAGGNRPQMFNRLTVQFCLFQCPLALPSACAAYRCRPTRHSNPRPRTTEHVRIARKRRDRSATIWAFVRVAAVFCRVAVVESSSSSPFARVAQICDTPGARICSS